MKPQMGESQLYQLNHQIEALKHIALSREIPPDLTLEDRVQVLHP